MTTTARTEHIYRGLWSVLVRYFRVPEQPPEVPGRAEPTSAPFKPAAGFLKYLKLWFWIVLMLIDVGLLACWIVIFVVDWRVGLALTPVALIVIIVPDIIAYIAVHLRYDTTWYVMTDRSMRIRRGVWIIEERTITYENIQNVKVTQGPVQRYFDIATVVVETAGAGTAAGKHGSTIGNRGVIEGVTNANEIRDRILVKMRQSKSAGLGDEPEQELSMQRRGSGWSSAHLDLLRQIHDELAAIPA